MNDVLAQLGSGAREVTLPATLRLPGEISDLHLSHTLRLLPGQRLVARGTLGLSDVVVKLYVGSKAQRHQGRERTGARALSSAAVKTAELLADGKIPALPNQTFDGPIYFLLYRALVATPLAFEPPLEDFLHCIDTVAALHQADLVQTDMHLGNFLVGTDGVYAIDADGIRQTLSLPRANALENLAVLFAQRTPLAQREQIQDWVARYRAQRGWGEDLPRLVHELMALTQRQRAHRVRRYLSKSLRDCTEFYVASTSGQRFVCVREALTDELLAFARDPAAVMERGEVLKAGNTATVVRAQMGEATFIVKRYNIKHRRHQLSQSLRPRSRACRAWRNGLLLQFLGIPTASPVALLETRQGVLRSTAYLIQEDLGSTDLQAASTSARVLRDLAPQIKSLFVTLGQVGLVHGDTKATNFILHQGELRLVDLDSLHRTPSWQTGIAQLNSPGIEKDRARFVQNWAGEPELGALAAQLMTEVVDHLPGKGAGAQRLL